MPISTDHIKLLESYRDKAYITSILCAQSAEHFEFLRSIINIDFKQFCHDSNEQYE